MAALRQSTTSTPTVMPWAPTMTTARAVKVDKPLSCRLSSGSLRQEFKVFSVEIRNEGTGMVRGIGGGNAEEKS